nr:hypothetical protein [Cryptosporangium phraense]
MAIVSSALTAADAVSSASAGNAWITRCGVGPAENSETRHP